jgi:chromosome segregation ATPase
MEVEQIDKQLEWLDGERRKDSEIVTRLTERLDSLEKDEKSRADQMKEQASEVTRLAGLAARINQFDEALGKHRQEISRQLGDAEDRRSKKEKDIEDLRKADQKEIGKKIEANRKKLEELQEIKRATKARQDEEVRLTRRIDSVEKHLDEFDTRNEDQIRSIASMEEGRKQDSRRIADAQSDLGELRKKADTLHGALDSTEDRVRRLETELAELVAAESERREGQLIWAEQQRGRLAEFEKDWKLWEERFLAFEDQATELSNRMLAYEEMYRGLRQLQQELDEVMDRLERRITEVSEMQRLAEDRFKQEWSSFQADEQKRWNSYRLTSDEQWREHERVHGGVDSDVELLDENLSQTMEDLSFIKEFESKQVSELFAVVRKWAETMERDSG